MKTTQKLFDLNVGLVALGAAIAALTIAAYWALMAEVRLADANIDEVTHIEARIHHEIGYGGLIHNFKNYVLRGSETDRHAAVRNHIQAVDLLDALAEHDEDPQAESLGQVRAALDAYRNNLDVAAAARRRGLRAEEIDQLVTIDDSQAIRQLKMRAAALRKALVERRDMLQDTKKEIFAALTVFLGAIILVAIMLGRMMVNRIRSLESRCEAQGAQYRRGLHPTNARSIT